jgi:deoxycytidylate deaminase
MREILLPNKNEIPSGTQYETCRSNHAEQNAIIQAGMEQMQDATMYIWVTILSAFCARDSLFRPE